VTTPDLEDLRRLHEAATPGPAEVRIRDGEARLVIGKDSATIAWCGHGNKQRAEANAALIAAMRNALPYLLELAERAEAEKP